jgi:hypothetical protein
MARKKEGKLDFYKGRIGLSLFSKLFLYIIRHHDGITKRMVEKNKENVPAFLKACIDLCLLSLLSRFVFLLVLT